MILQKFLSPEILLRFGRSEQYGLVSKVELEYQGFFIALPFSFAFAIGLGIQGTIQGAPLNQSKLLALALHTHCWCEGTTLDPCTSAVSAGWCWQQSWPCGTGKSWHWQNQTSLADAGAVLDSTREGRGWVSWEVGLKLGCGQ